MRKKIAVLLFSVFAAGILVISSDKPAPQNPQIRIEGMVKQPLTLTMDKLMKMQSVPARLNEFSLDKDYHGAFNYMGVPLRALLELAVIRKPDTANYNKLSDLVIVVKNDEGKKAVLSWGEIFYRNPSEVILAFNYDPIFPHKSCDGCHDPETYGVWLNPLKRKVGLPKLVVTGDRFDGRCLENVSNIEVVDLRPDIKCVKKKPLFSEKFSLTGAVKTPGEFATLASYRHFETLSMQVGDGRGYHGWKVFDGVPLVDILKDAGIAPDPGSVLMISAPDGYRSSVSCGELFLNPQGKNIIIADGVDGTPLKKDGKFAAVFPDDLSADRCVKAVEKIEVINVK